MPRKKGPEWKVLSDEYAKVWGKDTGMHEFCMKNTSAVVILSQGEVFAVDRPHIETSFCFGHGFCGITTEEDEERANRMADKAERDQDYFFEENMRRTGFDYQIDELSREGNEVLIRHAYIDHSNRIVSFTAGAPWNVEQYKDDAFIRVATDKDRKAIIRALEEAKDEFAKRLMTYLKRYGLSKVRSWTYLSD